MRVMEELSVEELVDRSAATAEQRIRVVEALAEAGFAPDQLGQLIAVGAYDLDWASVVFPGADRTADHHAGAGDGGNRAAGEPGPAPV
jgi:hypothetical protein